MKELTIGSDPEALLRNKKTKEIVSAIPFIKEGKQNPRNLGDGYKVLHDNVLVEFNVPPAKSKREFISNLREGFRRIHEVIGAEFELVPQASHEFHKKFLKDRDARIFGCDPEYCAYEMRVKLPPDCRTNLRSCGAHIHIGRADFENPEDEVLMNPFSKARVIRLMDLFVGLTLTMLDKDPTSPARKRLYGLAARHRPTDYGVEYRTPPNYWLRSPQLAELVYDLTTRAVGIEAIGKSAKILNLIPAEQVQSAINENKPATCAELLKRLPLPKDFNARIALFKKQLPNSLKEWNI